MNAHNGWAFNSDSVTIVVTITTAKISITIVAIWYTHAHK